MQNLNPFQLPPGSNGPPQADPKRQAGSALRGYAYQIWITALAWIRLQPSQKLYLEVAEDFALQSTGSLEAIQVKHSATSRKVTLNDRDVKNAIVSFVDLQQRNTLCDVYLRFLTTKPIGIEKDSRKPFGEEKGIEYWHKAATGKEGVTPIRKYLESDQFPCSVKRFIQDLSDVELRDKLISRISWDCGQPSFSEIKNELIESLESMGSGRFRYSAEDASTIAHKLCSHILCTCASERTSSRVLTPISLEKIIESVTMMPVSKVILNNLLNQLTASRNALPGTTTSNVHLSIAHDAWFYKGSDLPRKSGVIRREGLERKLKNAITQKGLAILSGSKGLGKSVTSQSFARSQYGEFYIIELNYDNPFSIRHILSIVVENVTQFHECILILENFNAIENSDLGLFLEFAISELRKSNVHVLITCHIQPPLAILSSLGIDQQSVVKCHYFSKDEIESLIRAHSGDAEEWSMPVFVRSGAGHPTMAHGLVTSLANGNWPENEKTLIRSSGFSATDNEKELTSIRKRLVSELPSEERDLLYRLSLIIGPFYRHLALALSKIEPAIARAGECIDHMTGPWIEELPSSQYRISSLVSECGKEMLSDEELRCIHECIVDEHIREGPIEISDIDRVLLHAMKAEKSEALFYLARAILISDSDMIRVIARESTLVRWRIEKPIFEKDSFASAYLRLAQFKLAEVTGDKARIRSVAIALCDEIDLIPTDQVRNRLWVYSILLIADSPGIAGIIDNWLSLVLRLISISRTLQFWKEGFDGIETAPIEPKWNGFRTIFNAGILGVHSVSRFESIIDQLCEIPSGLRSLLLEPVDASCSDYFELVRHAWLQDRKDPNYDAEDALHRYGRIAKKTSDWEERCVSLQAYAVQSAILDHDLADPSRGLTVIQNAAKICGDEPILVRSMGQMCLSKHDYVQAFTIYKWLVEKPSTSNPSRKAHTFGEAARAAFHCDNLELADEWLMAAANLAQNNNSEDLNALSLGFKADAAVMALRLGHISRALLRLEEVVEGLTILDPDASLRIRYTHTAVRRVVLIIKSFLCDDTGSTGHQLTDLAPVICSVPEPPDTIRQDPLIHIDYLWYVLSEVEFVSRTNVGIYQSLLQRMPLGPIKKYEIYLRLVAMRCRIEDLDAVGVVTCIRDYIEAAVFELNDTKQLEEDAFSPTRGDITETIQDYHQNVQAMSVIKDVFVAFLMRSVMSDDLNSVKDLRNTLSARFGEQFPCMDLLKNATGMPRKTDNLECLIAEVICQYFNQKVTAPGDIWILGMYFFTWTTESVFRNSLSGELVKWLQFQWRHIINEQRSFLNNPSQTVPLIERVLDDAQDNFEFIARLLLVASEAVGLNLSSTRKQFFRQYISVRSASS